MLLREQPVQDTFLPAPAPPDKSSLTIPHIFGFKTPGEKAQLAGLLSPACLLAGTRDLIGKYLTPSTSFWMVVGGRPLQLPFHQNTTLIYQLEIKVRSRGDKNIHCSAGTECWRKCQRWKLGKGEGMFSTEHSMSVQSTVKWFDVASFG